jgi:secreted trypsin-like serine protease
MSLNSSRKETIMKLTFIFFACLLGIYSASAEESESIPFIVGGENATVEEYPFIAGVYNEGDWTCGGAIINTRSVLTVTRRKWFLYLQ